MASIHDNEIINYEVDFKENRIKINTKNTQNNVVTILFEGVFIHLFELEMPESIILDVEESTYEKFVEENKKILEEKNAMDGQYIILI